MNETTGEHSAAWPQPNSSPSRVLRVLRAFAVKVQPRIHREAAKSAKISRRKILSCQQRIFGLVVQMNTERPRRNQKASPQRRAERGGSSLERTLPASGVRSVSNSRTQDA